MQKLFALLFLSLWPVAALAQETETGFYHQFGEPGSTGSMRVRFSRLGGGVVSLQLTDHYRSADAGKRTPHEPGDYMLLVDSADHALRLLSNEATPRFPQNLGRDAWKVTPSADAVTFEMDSGNGLVLEKVVRHDAAQRGLVVELALKNKNADPGGQLSLTLLGPMLVNPAEVSFLGTSSVAIAAARDGTNKHVGPSAGAVQVLDLDLRNLSFAGTANRFFGTFLYPLDDASRAALQRIEVDTGPAAAVRIDETSETKANSSTRARYSLNLAVPAQNAETRLRFGLYLGPKSSRVFETLAEPERFAPILDVDLASPCCVIEVPGGRFMAKVLLSLLGWFHGIVNNWGFAIIMLTILVRGLLAPLNFHMQKSMRAFGARMAVLKPKLDALKAKYGDDQKAYQQAMIAFQREHKMLPPLGGCLPILATMPIYIGLFTALRTAYDLRQQPFVSWIDDLSRADALFDLPFGLAWLPTFNLLPLVWISLFVWMQLRMPLPTDPQQRQVQRMMRYMPILFGVMLYGYASALLVYMVTSMVWSLLESAIVKRILGPVDPNVAAMAPTPM